MISIKIRDAKNFMGKLLGSTLFDTYFLIEASITTFNNFFIDGHLQKDYYSQQELEENGLDEQPFSTWAQVRPHCFQLIKGKKTPLNVKIVLQLPPCDVEKFLQESGFVINVHDINGLYLNIYYDENGITCTTGTSLRIFSLDKTFENAWDNYINKLLVNFQ